VAWRITCSPKDLGGLGVPDLCVMGFALRLCWEWLSRVVNVPRRSMDPLTVEARAHRRCHVPGVRLRSAG
jgi:hypothetical protein